MGGIVGRFLSFDKLIGTTLIKILYFLGLVGIGFSAIGLLFSAFGAMRYDFVAGLGGLVVVPIFIVLAVLVWRFVCELYILLFRMSDDLRDIKNLKESGSTLTGDGSN